MLCKGFEDKCLISAVFKIMQYYKKILILILGIK